MHTGKIDEIIKETKEKYGINIKIFLTKKGWVFEPLDKLTKNQKTIDDAKRYVAKRLSEGQYLELLDRAKSELVVHHTNYDKVFLV